MAPKKNQTTAAVVAVSSSNGNGTDNGSAASRVSVSARARGSGGDDVPAAGSSSSPVPAACVPAPASSSASSSSASSSSASSSSASCPPVAPARWALLPVVDVAGVSGGLPTIASRWVPLYDHGDGSSGLLLLGGEHLGRDHAADENDNDNEIHDVEGGVKKKNKSDEEEEDGGGVLGDKSFNNNKVNTSVDTTFLPAASSTSSEEVFTTVAADTSTFDTTTVTTSSAANRRPAPPPFPCPPAPRLSPLLKGKTNLTEDFLSVVLAKPNPFNGFWTATSPAPDAVVPFPSAAEYTYEANRRRTSTSTSNNSQVHPGQPSLSSSPVDNVVASGQGEVCVDDDKDKKKTRRQQKRVEFVKRKKCAANARQKRKQKRQQQQSLESASSSFSSSSSSKVLCGPPSRSWPLPRLQGHLVRDIRFGDATYQYMDEDYVRQLWTEKLDPHQQFARLQKVDPGFAVASAGQTKHEFAAFAAPLVVVVDDDDMESSGIEGLINPPTNGTHYHDHHQYDGDNHEYAQLELMVGVAAGPQVDFSSASSGRRQVASAPDLNDHIYSGLSSSEVDEHAGAPASAVVAAPTFSPSSFSATAKPFVPRSLAPTDVAPEFVPTSGQNGARPSLSAIAEEFVPVASVAPPLAAAVPQQYLPAVDESLLSLPVLPPFSPGPLSSVQQQHHNFAREEVLSVSDPDSVNSWTDHRRGHPRAARHLRPSSQVASGLVRGHKRGRHQVVSRPSSSSVGPASSSSLPSFSFPASPAPAAAAATKDEEEEKPSPALASAAAPFDPSRPDFDENFPPLGQTPPAPAPAKAKAKASKQQQPAASSPAGSTSYGNGDEEDIYSASPVLRSASVVGAFAASEGESEKKETTEGAVCGEGEDVGRAGDGGFVPAAVVGSGSGFLPGVVTGAVPGLDFGFGFAPGAVPAALGAFNTALGLAPGAAPTVTGLYAPIPGLGPVFPGPASVAPVLPGGFFSGPGSAGPVVPVFASPALSGLPGLPAFPVGFDAPFSFPDGNPSPHPSFASGFGPGFGPGFVPGFEPGPPAFLPAPAAPHPQAYPHGYGQPPFLPPLNPPLALHNNHGSGNGFGNNFGLGDDRGPEYHHPSPPRPTSPRPVSPRSAPASSPDRPRRRRVRFADFNTVIHFPDSIDGNVDAVYESVPQGPPGADRAAVAADGGLSSAGGSGSIWQGLDNWVGSAAELVESSRLASFGSRGARHEAEAFGTGLGVRSFGPGSGGAGSPSSYGFESHPPFAFSSGFESHQTIATEPETEPEPLPAPYNYFSSLPSFSPSASLPSGFAPVEPVPVPDISGGPAISSAPFAGPDDVSGPAFSTADPAVAFSAAVAGFSAAAAAFSATATAAATAAAAQANTQQHLYRVPPPLFQELLSRVPVQDLVDDLRRAGVVDREAEAWQLRRPVGERNWDLTSSGAGGAEEGRMSREVVIDQEVQKGSNSREVVMNQEDPEGQEVQEEIGLGGLTAAVRELVREIDEFDD
ncbi:hypothetical protein B0T20DRAFT_500541 [Sordaria brevicollis]|uniref:Uncharacterized protein n=1 Tax=Sordaria brevicollis TaxID=83679 RepID=A0AAE0PBS8_SORBR|nr:hypothetical protein B0T20DRAFT_500541 [Sordaria brevicollis]